MAAAAVWPTDAVARRPTVRLREATEADASRLADLYAASGSPAKDPTTVRSWLREGGTLLVERDSGVVLAAVRWLPRGKGWSVERVTTRPEERGNGFGRWLMTKLEAMAIRGNVASLDLVLDDPELLEYYQRLGYRAAGTDPLSLSKRVGGVWQRQPTS